MMKISINFREYICARGIIRYSVIFPLLLLCSCDRAPSFSILGSFFPAWIFCIVAAILLTAGVRALLLRFQFEQELGPLVLVYPSLAAFFAFTLWLIFFS